MLFYDGVYTRYILLHTNIPTNYSSNQVVEVSEYSKNVSITCSAHTGALFRDGVMQTFPRVTIATITPQDNNDVYKCERIIGGQVLFEVSITLKVLLAPTTTMMSTTTPTTPTTPTTQTTTTTTTTTAPTPTTTTPTATTTITTTTPTITTTAATTQTTTPTTTPTTPTTTPPVTTITTTITPTTRANDTQTELVDATPLYLTIGVLVGVLAILIPVTIVMVLVIVFMVNRMTTKKSGFTKHKQINNTENTTPGVNNNKKEYIYLDDLLINPVPPSNSQKPVYKKLLQTNTSITSPIESTPEDKDGYVIMDQLEGSIGAGGKSDPCVEENVVPNDEFQYENVRPSLYESTTTK